MNYPSTNLIKIGDAIDSIFYHYNKNDVFYASLSLTPSKFIQREKECTYQKQPIL